MADRDTTYTAALDLGQARDPSACAIVEHKGDGREALHRVVYLHRWPLGTGYPQVARDVCDMLARPPMPGHSLVLDATGVGAAVRDMLTQAHLDAHVAAYTITAGSNSGKRTVTKADLIGGLQAALGEGRLKIAALPLAEALRRELEGFRVEVNAAGNTRYDIARDGHGHGDLAVAVGLALHHHGRFKRLPLPRFLRFATTEGGPVPPHQRGARPKYRPTRIVACGMADLAQVAHEADEYALVITTSDPGSAMPDLEGLTFLPAATLHLTFADVDPREHGDNYHDRIEPWGQTLDKLVMTRQEHGKALWRFILAKRERRPTLIVTADGGGRDRRALSLAYAIADTLRYSRKQVCSVGDPEANHDRAAPPDRFVYDTARAGRALVIVW